MGRSPSFSQPRPAMNTARPQGNAGAAAGGAGYADRNQTAAHPAGAAAAGAGYADRNQTAAHPAGAAAAGRRGMPIATRGWLTPQVPPPPARAMPTGTSTTGTIPA